MRRRSPAFLFLVLALCATPHAQSATRADPNAWTSYGFDNQLGNAVPTQAFTLGAVPKLRLDWAQQLDGAVFASPLAANVDG